MNRFYLRYVNENSYLKSYKVKRSTKNIPNEFVITLTEDFDAAQPFDEDDYIIELSQLTEIIELIPAGSVSNDLETLSNRSEKPSKSTVNTPELPAWA